MAGGVPQLLSLGISLPCSLPQLLEGAGWNFPLLCLTSLAQPSSSSQPFQLMAQLPSCCARGGSNEWAGVPAGKFEGQLGQYAVIFFPRHQAQTESLFMSL